MKGFYAHKNNTAQTDIPNNAYTKITFGTTRHNLGNTYWESNSEWIPVAGPVLIGGQIYVTGCTVTNPSAFVAKVFKNGGDVAAGIGAKGAVDGVIAIPFSMMDICDGNDKYEVKLYCSTPTTATVDGNAAHTYFWGISFGG